MCWEKEQKRPLLFLVCLEAGAYWGFSCVCTYASDLRRPLSFSHGIERGGAYSRIRAWRKMKEVVNFKHTITICTYNNNIFSITKGMLEPSLSLFFSNILWHCRHIARLAPCRSLACESLIIRWSWATHRKVLPEIPFNLPQRCETKQKQSQDLPLHYLLR